MAGTAHSRRRVRPADAAPAERRQKERPQMAPQDAATIGRQWRMAQNKGSGLIQATQANGEGRPVAAANRSALRTSEATKAVAFIHRCVRVEQLIFPEAKAASPQLRCATSRQPTKRPRIGNGPDREIISGRSRPRLSCGVVASCARAAGLHAAANGFAERASET